MYIRSSITQQHHVRRRRVWHFNIEAPKKRKLMSGFIAVRKGTLTQNYETPDPHGLSKVITWERPWTVISRQQENDTLPGQQNISDMENGLGLDNSFCKDGQRRRIEDVDVF